MPGPATSLPGPFLSSFLSLVNKTRGLRLCFWGAGALTLARLGLCRFVCMAGGPWGAAVSPPPWGRPARVSPQAPPTRKGVPGGRGPRLCASSRGRVSPRPRALGAAYAVSGLPGGAQWPPQGTFLTPCPSTRGRLLFPAFVASSGQLTFDVYFLTFHHLCRKRTQPPYLGAGRFRGAGRAAAAAKLLLFRDWGHGHLWR